jgi:hypothetical protein
MRTELVAECRKCCKGGAAATEAANTRLFGRAELQVTKRNLARFPEVQQFVDKSASGFAKLKVKVRARRAGPMASRSHALDQRSLPDFTPRGRFCCP